MPLAVYNKSIYRNTSLSKKKHLQYRNNIVSENISEHQNIEHAREALITGCLLRYIICNYSNGANAIEQSAHRLR